MKKFILTKLGYKNLDGTRGFTILEMVVVIAILGILSSILLPEVTKQLDKTRKGQAIIEIKTMKNAMELYYAENNTFPTTKTNINSLMKEDGVLAGKYGQADADDPWGNPYYIKTSASDYTIWSEGPNTGDTEADDIYTDKSKTDINVSSTNIETTSSITNSNDNS